MSEYWKDLYNKSMDLEELRQELLCDYMERLADLAEIAEQRGITMFGYQGARPGWEDYPTEEDALVDPAYIDRVNKYNESLVPFLVRTPYSVTYQYGLAFEIDGPHVVFTSIQEADCAEGMYYDELRYPFDPTLEGNFLQCAHVIMLIEDTLNATN